MGMKSPGATLHYDADGIGLYTQISVVTMFQPGNASWEDSDETHLESTSAIKEFSAGWGDEGEAHFKSKFTAAQFGAFRTIAAARTSYYWAFHAPLQSGETTPFMLDWYGHIKGINWDSFERSKSDVIQVEFVMKLSGPITVTQPT